MISFNGKFNLTVSFEKKMIQSKDIVQNNIWKNTPV